MSGVNSIYLVVSSSYLENRTSKRFLKSNFGFGNLHRKGLFAGKRLKNVPRKSRRKNSFFPFNKFVWNEKMLLY